MSNSEDINDEDSIKNFKESEIKCFQCKKKVVDATKCYKCFEYFHNKCMEKSANQETSICKHDGGSIERLALEIRDLQTQNKIVNIELTYLKELLKETQEKNVILVEHNALLKEKIKFQSEKVTTKNDKYQMSKNVNSTHNQTGISNVKPERAPTSRVKVVNTEVRSQNIDHETPSTSSAAPSRVYYEKENKQTELKTSSNVFENQQETSWTTVVKRQRKKKTSLLCTGSQQVTAESKIKGAQKRKWLYAGKIKGPNATAVDLKDFLRISVGTDDFEIKKLPTQGNNSAFSVGVPTDELFMKLSKPEYWPDGVILREFNFRNFFRNDYNPNPRMKQ